jgi:hypothetical protein
MPEKKPRKPRPSVAANMVKKLLMSMPQRLLDAPGHAGEHHRSVAHGRALHEWCERVRSALRTLGEAPPSTRPVDIEIASLARFLLGKFEPQRSEPQPHQSRSHTAGAVRPDPQARSAIQDMMYTPLAAAAQHSRPHIAASTTDTTPAASRT